MAVSMQDVGCSLQGCGTIYTKKCLNECFGFKCVLGLAQILAVFFL